ncbi:Uncharacterised protein [Vibrio cholerae]|nr:Uncharacterised protein [Vibrio cholerae]
MGYTCQKKRVGLRPPFHLLLVTYDAKLYH